MIESSGTWRRASAFKAQSQVGGIMQAFRVSGTAPFGSQRQKFDLDLVADSADDAEHRCYSIIGSRHKANRRSITINSVSEIDPRTSTEARVLDAFREQIAAAGGTIAPAAEEE
jgi:ribosomal protein L20A (L18A)